MIRRDAGPHKPPPGLLLIGASVLGFVVFAVLSSLMEIAGVAGGGVCSSGLA